MQPYLEHAAETWPKLGNVAFQTATAKTMLSVHCTKTLLVEPMFPLRESYRRAVKIESSTHPIYRKFYSNIDTVQCRIAL